MLPRFVVALPQDSLLQSSPPFDFPNVSMRVFPVRADMSRVQSLVDGWINAILPPEVGYFRVFTPFVALVALNYGRAAVIPSNLGWSSQHEVTFSVPLQWYKLGSRGFELHDFAVLSPYIFVDNELSVPAGREVFGWQKVLIWLDPLADRWMQNPRAPVKHAGMTTLAFRQVYAGKQQQRIPFVDIEEAPAGTWLQYPSDRQNPHLPWVALHNTIDAISDAGLDLYHLLAGLGLTQRREAPLPGGSRAWLDPSPASLRRTMVALRDMLSPYSPNRHTNQINLKQFRDAEHPTSACYQEVNNTVMRVHEINRMGFLGESRILAGDPTGGYRISLHQWDSLPIAEMLGIEGKRSASADGSLVSSIRPVFPMWADMDLGYAEERHVLAWRSKDRGWVFGDGGASSRSRQATVASGEGREAGIPYNTTLGASSPIIYGPFETPAMTIRALPLLATKAKLQELCDTALNEPLCDMDGAGSAPGDDARATGFSFEPWGSYVYLLICTSDATYSITNNIGSWPSDTASFAIPVRCYRDGVPDGFALYCPFSFSASSLQTAAGSELNGTRMMSAKIESPSSTWMEDGGPAEGHARTFAVISAMIPPILNAGERAEMRALIRVDLRSTDALHADRRPVEVSWPLALKADLERRPRLGAAAPPDDRAASFEDLTVGRARAIDFLADQKPLRFVSLKQFRDVARPARACYQALVEVEQRLLAIDRIEEIEYPLDIGIVEYESMPLVRMLGLVPRSVRHENGMRVHVLEPIRPFWGRAHHREELGNNLAVQERDLVWARHDQVGAQAERRKASQAQAARDGERRLHLDRIDLGVPHGIARFVALQRGTPGQARLGPPMSVSVPPDREAALARIEPQWVLESMLSREWESHDRPVWRHRRNEIADRLAKLGKHHSAFTERTRSRIQELLDEHDKVKKNRHADIRQVIEKKLLPHFALLSWLLSEARHLDDIARSHQLDFDPGPQPSRVSASDPHGALKQASQFYAKDELTKLRAGLQRQGVALIDQAESLAENDPVLRRLLDAAMELVAEPARSELRTAHTVFILKKQASLTVFDLALRHMFGGDVVLPEALVDDLQETRAFTVSRLVLYLVWRSTFVTGRGEKKRAWTAFLRLCFREVDQARDDLILAIAKCWQKPYFCVRRDTAGPPEVQKTVFPSAHCWREHDGGDLWYSPPESPETEPEDEPKSLFVLGQD
jgi:hypothetical protein